MNSFRAGDKVVITETTPFYSVGAVGVIVGYDDTSFLVKFESGDFEKSEDNIWYVYEDEMENTNV